MKYELNELYNGDNFDLYCTCINKKVIDLTKKEKEYLTDNYHEEREHEAWDYISSYNDDGYKVQSILVDFKCGLSCRGVLIHTELKDIIEIDEDSFLVDSDFNQICELDDEYIRYSLRKEILERIGFCDSDLSNYCCGKWESDCTIYNFDEYINDMIDEVQYLINQEVGRNICDFDYVIELLENIEYFQKVKNNNCKKDSVELCNDLVLVNYDNNYYIVHFVH